MLNDEEYNELENLKQKILDDDKKRESYDDDDFNFDELLGIQQGKGKHIRKTTRRKRKSVKKHVTNVKKNKRKYNKTKRNIFNNKAEKRKTKRRVWRNRK